MRWTDLKTALVAGAWAYLLFVGVDALINMKARQIAGYPVFGQIILYAAIPALFLFLVIVAVVLSGRARWFYDFYPFAVVPVLMVWGGGV
ncbi:hypothetical protein VF10_21540 [Nostoc linckia z13]|uniref:hypothetical protein n=1 Tax=Nostoc linckia TaxID=92942 RepID=UPI000BFFD0B1|nr:hypothetical protein [Nostoc linckia]PHK19529.1 hypothetical protein VF10_21540 [Nostoc linckia z13]